MNHSVCEYLLSAGKNGIKEADVTFIPAKVFSPYMECLSTETNPIEVNPFFRYEKIFSNLLTRENEDILKELTDFVFDFWMHEVFEMERLSGMTRKAFFKSGLLREMREACKDFGVFCEEEQDMFMNQVLNLYSGGDCGILLCNALKLFFSKVYVYLLDDRKILLYIGEKESFAAKKKIRFLIDVFLPIGMETEIFWDKHFGVFGVEETMLLDEIALI